VSESANVGEVDASRETSGVLLPAEPSLFLPVAAVARLLEPAAAPLVLRVNSVPWLSEQKHAYVRQGVVAALPLLQHSVKELRGVPPELLALGVDLAIRGLVAALKDLFD